MKIRLKIMIPLLTALILLTLAFVWNDHKRRTSELAASLSKTANTVEKLIDSEIRADVQIMSTALDSLTRDPRLQKSFAEQNREKLALQSQEAFDRLKSKNLITHFYYHRLDHTNFLRLHELDHYDDKIGRKTLKEAQATGAPSYGIEQGPTGASVLRVVFPLNHHGKRIGYMELGKEFQDILHKIEEIVGLKTLLLAEKKWVQREKWEKRNNKAAFTVSWDFMPDHAVMASTLPNIPENIKRLRIQPDATSGYIPENPNLSQNSSGYDLIVVPFRNFSKQKVADIVLFYDSSSVVQASQKSAFITFLAIFAIGFCLFAFFHIFLGRVENLLQRQQATLVSNSKMASLGEMAGGVAHEINTPLAAIILNAQILQSKNEKLSPPNSEVANRAQAIIDIGDRIATIINGLRGFSRSGKEDEFQIFQAHNWIQDTLNLCSEKFKNRSIELIVKEDFLDVQIHGQLVQLSQTLLNLLSNSFDVVQNSPGAWVRLDAAVKGQNFELSVTDCGQGIPKEIATKMFDPFFTTKDIGQGTGLGLSISKGIMQSHGGDLIYDSSSENTRFIIRLPLSKSKKQEAA